MKEDKDLNNENMQSSIKNNPSTELPHEKDRVYEQRVENDEGQSPKYLTWLQQDAIDDLRSRWTSIQAQFVDQPCTSIEQADALLTDAMERIHQQLAAHQSTIRDRWYNKDDATTEDLRLTLQDYRSFLHHLIDH